MTIYIVLVWLAGQLYVFFHDGLYTITSSVEVGKNKQGFVIWDAGHVTNQNLERGIAFTLR